MAENTKSNNFMAKLATFIVDKRNLFFLIFAILIIFSAFSRNWVNVENDLTAYLPDGTETKAGLDLMADEFTTFGSAKIVAANVTMADAEKIEEIIKNDDDVSTYTFDDSNEHFVNSTALFDVTFVYPEDDDRALEALDELKESLSDYDLYVQTSMGDQSSELIASEMSVVIVLVCIVVLVVLFATSQTYAEVPVLIITFVASAIINMGTNFLLGTISFVSNSVTIVLQLALSIDYAIILCNRFKEEHETLPVREAVIEALTKSIPEIFSSSLTTVGGLAALLFMQFKIGPDMGINLIKAILLSLLSVFTLMPGILMLFGNLIDKTHHKSFIPKIDFVGKFAYATRGIVPFIFVGVIAVAGYLSTKTPYVYSYDTIETPITNISQETDNLIKENFGTKNMMALIVPTGNYETEKALLNEITSKDYVNSAVGLSNTEALDGYMLTDKLTPRQFSELSDVDFEVAELAYAAYAANDENYGKIVGGISSYSVPLMDMFIFVHKEIDEGYVTLDDDLTDTLNDAYVQINNAKLQLQGENFSRMLIYFDLPLSGDSTFSAIDEVRSIAKKYYPDGDVYLVGDSTANYDFCTSFQTDNIVVSVLSILVVLVVLLFTFTSVGMPLLLILVIQGVIWINFIFPTVEHKDIFFMAYLIVSSIQMGANIDYAIVISGRYMELKNKMSHRDAIIQTMNLSFPTIITSGSILAIAGGLIGQLSSEATIVGIGQALGRGTVISLIIVMFVLPQILLLGGGIIEKTSFSVKTKLRRYSSSGKIIVDGLVRGNISGTVNGIFKGTIDGDADLSVISGSARNEADEQAALALEENLAEDNSGKESC